MNFGVPVITPPMYYYFVYPSNIFLTNRTEPNQKALVAPQNPIIEVETGLELNEIVVTKDDLEKEGYQQSKRPWTEEEDQLLMSLCSNPNAFFDEVATHLPGRNSKMCYSRYRRLTNQCKKYWTKAENEKLKALVEQLGPNNWKGLVDYFSDRSFKQLKDHYQNFLQPSLDAKEWTLQEDLQLIRLINTYGQKWKHIQSLMSHRSCSQLKNRFFGRIKRINDKKLASLRGRQTNTLQLNEL